jgi:hypothetical protein
MTRILAIMGSGETTPTMTKHHKRLFEAAGPGPKVMLDTPYGFQENADDITQRTLEYFAVSVVTTLTVASLRTADVEPREVATVTAAALDASWLYAGPGSPTYAMSVWSAAGLGPVIGRRLSTAGSGVTVFSSAAALTLGPSCVPVYEIYKVGARPFWAQGLDVIKTASGLECVVIPHFDNAEGGNHDTRFCYLGETRLRAMEAMLPDSTWVLGIDEHTVAVFDLDQGTVDVGGRGGLTVRTRTDAIRFESGSTTTLEELQALGAGVRSQSANTSQQPSAAVPPRGEALDHEQTVESSTLAGVATQAESEFGTRIAAGEPASGVDAALRLERELESWKGDTSTTNERDLARAALHRMIVRLGELAVDGSRDPRDVLGPLVEIVLNERRLARESKDFAASDRLRDALTSAGVELRDTKDGQQWSLLNHQDT